MKNKQRFLVVDTETGGLDPEQHSILSIAGVLWEPNGEIETLFNFYVNEPELSYVSRAMEVNKIDINDVKAQGLTPKQSVLAIRASLDKVLGPKRRAIQLVAHNAPFDMGFIRRLYALAGEDFGKDFRNRALDTCSILQFLMLSGKVSGYRASGDVLFEAAGVKIDEKDRHTALGDAMATAKSINYLVNQF